MPNPTATNPQTGQKVQWDGTKWIPLVVSQASAPGALKRFATSAVGLPENVDTSVAGNKAELPNLVKMGTWMDALKQAASSLNPVGGMQQSTGAAINRMGQPGIANKAAGATEYAVSGIPWAGPMIANSMEKSASGDLAGGIGSAIPAALAASGVASAAPAVAESQWLHSPGRSLWGAGTGLGITGENLGRDAYINDANKVLDKYNNDVYDAKQKHAEAVAKAGTDNAEIRAAHELDVQKIRNKYMTDLQDARQSATAKSAAESEATTKQKGLTKLGGPVYQRLQGMADKVTDNVNQLWTNVRARNTANWGALRIATGDATANLAPVQQAIVDAQQNILKGSPENLKIFNNILAEGQPKGGAFIDGESGLTPAISSESIPVDDMRGYMTEIGDKLYSGGEVPGDVRRALKAVSDAGDKEVSRVYDAAGQGKTYRSLKADYAQYAGDFLDHDGALYKLLHQAEPKDRIDLLGGDTGRAVTDALSNYAKDFNLNKAAKSGEMTPIQLTEATRNLQQQIRQMSRSVPAEVPKPVMGQGAPSVPYVPQPPAPEPDPVNIKGFSPSQWRLNEMTKRSKMFTEQSRMETGVLGAPTIPVRRTLGWLYNNPGFRGWMAEYTHPTGQTITSIPSMRSSMPPITPAIKSGLEQEAGHPFANPEQAKDYLIAKVIAAQAAAKIAELNSSLKPFINGGK
jgi:hypothetical protein